MWVWIFAFKGICREGSVILPSFFAKMWAKIPKNGYRRGKEEMCLLYSGRNDMMNDEKLSRNRAHRQIL